MQQDNWQATYPPLHEYQAQIQSYSTIDTKSFLDLQPRLRSTLIRFEQLQNWSRVLIVNAPDSPIYRDVLVDAFSEVSNKPVFKAETLDMKSVLGEYQAKDGKVVNTLDGMLQRAHHGYLLVSANLLLANPASWVLLKSALLGESVSPLATNAEQTAFPPPSYKSDCKLVIIGDSNQLADLEYLDSDLSSGFSLFSEIELEFKIDAERILDYLGYLKWIENKFSLPTLAHTGIERLITAGARQTEDQSFLPIGLVWYNQLLSEAAIESNQQPLTSEFIDAAIEHKYQREAYLPERALEDILNGQVIIETNGEQVGQVNGLTVIDVPGHPISYGEPARISCVIHFGDGDIADVERKAELGGNLHAKGMMIMQAFVSSALDLDEPLPYSASVVFEQSYCEVDGDSASLAELCSLVSALSGHPIDQQIAVTGAVDQFGRVQAVGGLNEKIEGFYRVCRHQGFTGGQGVILPKTNLQHLSLHKDVINSVKCGEFHIWSVENVDEALPIITGIPFRGDEAESIINKIADRIEHFEKHEHSPSLLSRLRSLWLRD